MLLDEIERELDAACDRCRDKGASALVIGLVDDGAVFQLCARANPKDEEQALALAANALEVIAEACAANDALPCAEFLRGIIAVIKETGPFSTLDKAVTVVDEVTH